MKEIDLKKRAQEIIDQFENNSANPGSSIYRIRESKSGKLVVVKEKPSGEEVHVPLSDVLTGGDDS